MVPDKEQLPMNKPVLKHKYIGKIFKRRVR